MELQLVAHVSTNEDGVTATVKKLSGEADGCLLIQCDSNRIALSLEELKEAISKLEEFSG
jgi:hypothetical protein